MANRATRDGGKPRRDAPEPAEPCFTYAMRNLIPPLPSLAEQLHALKFGRF